MCLCSRVLSHAGTGNQLLKWIGDVWHHVKEITWPIILVCSVHSVNSRINQATGERERRLSAVYLQHAIGHDIMRQFQGGADTLVSPAEAERFINEVRRAVGWLMSCIVARAY